jgi:hypothetical protein
LSLQKGCNVPDYNLSHIGEREMTHHDERF